MLNFALIGAGRIGVSHAALIAAHPKARLAYVIDASPDAAASLAARHGAAVASWQAALADPGVDAVLIASSTDTHADFIEDAARAGKAMLTEKPIDLSLERIDRCLAIAAASKARLTVGFNRRFDPAIMALKARLDAGAIGRANQIIIVNRDAEAPPPEFLRRSGGIFRDMAIHDYDIACHLFAERPVSVFATGSALVDAGAAETGDFDTATTLLTMKSGATALITNARCARFGFDFRLEALGSEGVLQIGNTPRTPLIEATAQGISQAKPAQNFFERFETAFIRQLDAFIESVTTDRVPAPNGADGRNASAIAEAAAESARSGRVVPL